MSSRPSDHEAVAAFNSVSTSSAEQAAQYSRSRRSSSRPFSEFTAAARRCVLRAGIVTVFDWIKSKESWYPLINRPAECCDVDPPVAAFERVIRARSNETLL